MMLVNGAGDGSYRVWYEEGITLDAGVTYTFTAWATGVYPVSPAELNFKFEVGDILLGNLTVSTDVPHWQEFTATVHRPGEWSCTGGGDPR